MLTITNKLTVDDLVVHLGAAADNLDAAAKEYYCMICGENIQPNAVQEARDRLIERIADVNVAAEALRLKLKISCDDIADVEAEKIERWRRRIENGV